MRGLFVTGTDTGAGKTVLSAALLAAMLAAGERVRAHKPVVTGLDDPPGRWPHDHELLAGLAGMTPEEVAPRRYGPAVSPHLAAALAGEELDGESLVEAARGGAGRGGDRSRASRDARSPATSGARSPASAPRGDGAGDGILVVEGVGGLLVPFSEDFSVRDLAVALGLPMLIAARPGLGTINHTLLTLRAARAAGLSVCAVVLTPWPERPSALERSNRETIADIGDVDVLGLPHVGAPDAQQLVAAGASLPWQRWLGPRDFAAGQP